MVGGLAKLAEGKASFLPIMSKKFNRICLGLLVGICKTSFGGLKGHCCVPIRLLTHFRITEKDLQLYHSASLKSSEIK